MPTVNIDGVSYPFEGKHRLLQFCLDNGIEIPYFCYHPSMSTPTNCRMCLIELGNHARDRATAELQYDEAGSPVVMWMPKPATSCNTMIADGMFVKTHRSSPKIKTAQEGVLEYMLINHPLDCPICDQAGECPLQIWTYKYGPEGSRFENQKVHKPKRIELGPNVVLDSERCINCTRCVRFTEEISESNQLTIVNRGDKNLPATAPGESFDDPYSMNTIDICPVGALTSRQHRFKARVWEMAYAPSIDMNDSTGANIYVWLRDNEVLRITPRHNAQVNDYWLPDAHRLNVQQYNENRVSGTFVKGTAVPFGDGISAAAKLLSANAKQADKVLLLGSAHASLESNFMLRQLANDLGISEIYYVPHVIPGHGDGWLIQDDRTPNAAACELLGFKALGIEELKAKCAVGLNLLYSLENDRVFAQLDDSIEGLTVVAHGLQQQPAYDKVDVLLPAACAIEGEGMYINHKGLAQATTLARQFRQMTPDQWMQLPKSRLDKGAVAADRWRNLDNVPDVLPSWKLLTMVGNEAGMAYSYSLHQDIFAALKAAFPDLLKDTHISYKPSKAAFKISQLDFAPQW